MKADFNFGVSRSIFKVLLVPGIFVLMFFQACSPKVAQEEAAEVTEEQLPEPPKEEGLSPCKKFFDNPNGQELLEDFVVYRDFIKIGDYEGALSRWKKVYENAPAADGKRWTVFSDGIRIYEHYYQQSDDSLQKEKYIDQIMDLYDGIARCYPEQESYVQARKAFDYYYNYPGQISDLQKFQLFKESVDEMELETPVFVINPLSALLVNLFLEDKIEIEEAREYAYRILNIIEYNLKEGADPKSWDIVRSFAPEILTRLEGVKDFYGCEYYKDKYFSSLDDVLGNCEEMIAIYSKLRYGNCPEDDQDLVYLNAKLQEYECIAAQPAVTSAAGKAYRCLREGDYGCALRQFEKAAKQAESNDEKAEYLLLAAKVNYAHLKNFPSARQYALQAAKVKPNWGEPYLLIGKLYASSGPLCGPGRGFDSQVVVWPAIDMWNKARAVDPSAAAKANRLINQYEQYMPSVEDIFSRPIKEGDTYKVGCWIQVETTVRAAPRP